MPSPLTGLAELVSRPLFRTAPVLAVADLTPRVRLIDLSLPGLSWRAGDKVQVRIAGLTTRTYTPVAAAPDVMRIVGFVHGDGPGAGWVRAVAVGDTVSLFGPRRSIDCSALSGPVVVVGDETSIGLLAAVSGVDGAEVTAVFEATEPDDVLVPAAHLNLPTPTVVARGSLPEAVAAAVSSGTSQVISGDAATVAAVRRHLRDQGIRPSTTLAKAYWAEGRRGLD